MPVPVPEGLVAPARVDTLGLELREEAQTVSQVQLVDGRMSSGHKRRLEDWEERSSTAEGTTGSLQEDVIDEVRQD